MGVLTKKDYIPNSEFTSEFFLEVEKRVPQDEIRTLEMNSRYVLNKGYSVAAYVAPNEQAWLPCCSASVLN